MSLKPSWSLRPDTTYLNHGSFGPPPTSVQEARRTWQQRLDEQPMDFFVRQAEPALRAARAGLAEFLGAQAADLAFVENATAGMNVVAASVRLQPGDEILLTDHEYGAVQRIWRRACEAQGAILRQVILPRPLEETQQVVDTIVAATTAQTRLVVVSHITSPTAVTLPVQQIGGALAERGVPLCVDGPHAIAQIPLSLSELCCDYYTASCHKWLCAPFGSGFLWVHPRHQTAIRPPMLSWGRLLPDEVTCWSDEFLWQGTRDPSSYLAVPAAIVALAAYGWDAFRRETHALAQRARQQLMEFTGLQPLVPDDPRWYGSMAHVPLPPGECRPLQQQLWEQYRIEVPIVSWGDQRWIRVSCHLYNDEGDLQKLMRALRELLPELRS